MRVTWALGLELAPRGRDDGCDGGVVEALAGDFAADKVGGADKDDFYAFTSSTQEPIS